MKEEKPEVLSQGSTPEPVESGCCLRSCGGSPIGTQESRHLNHEAEETIRMLKSAEKEAVEK